MIDKYIGLFRFWVGGGGQLLVYIYVMYGKVKIAPVSPYIVI